MKDRKIKVMKLLKEKAKPARKQVVILPYIPLEDIKKPKKVNKKRFLYLSNEVGKHWPDDNTVPSHTTSTHS